MIVFAVSFESVAVLMAPIGFSAVGLLFLALAIGTFARNTEQRGWPVVPAVINTSSLKSYVSTERDQDGYDREYTYFEADITYTYSVADQVYEGTGIAQSLGATTSGDKMRAIVDRYPVGAEVLVRYDPDDPSVAWLEVHRSWGGIILGAFGALLLGLGVLTFYLWLTVPPLE